MPKPSLFKRFNTAYPFYLAAVPLTVGGGYLAYNKLTEKKADTQLLYKQAEQRLYGVDNEN